MRFSDAIEEFQRFLGNQRHSGPLVWITPSDLMLAGRALLIRPRAEATAESERMFHEATERGYGLRWRQSRVWTIASAASSSFPENAEDAASHFLAPPVTMKVRKELRSAEQPGPFRWWLVRKMASDRVQVRSLQFFGYELDRRQRVVSG